MHLALSKFSQSTLKVLSISHILENYLRLHSFFSPNTISLAILRAVRRCPILVSFCLSTIKCFIRRKAIGNGFLMATGIIYASVYIGGFMRLCQHYAMPLNDAFDLCYHELIQLAKDFHTTYNNVNYAIFIIIFLVITIGNILLVKLLETSQRHYTPYQPDNCK